MYSVVIPSLGRLQYLNELLGSIAAQTLQATEILLLLDDNDHCHSIASEILAVPGVQIVFCKGLNLAEKRNFGALKASTGWLVFSDDDDIWSRNRAQAVIDVLAECGVCCHNFGKFGAEHGQDMGRLGTANRAIGLRDLFVGVNFFGGGSSIAARREIVLTLPFSPEFRYCEDFEWWIRVILCGVRVQYLGESLVSYRTHAHNMTSSAWRIARYNLMIFRKNFIHGAVAMGVSVAVLGRTAIQCALLILRKF